MPRELAGWGVTPLWHPAYGLLLALAAAAYLEVTVGPLSRCRPASTGQVSRFLSGLVALYLAEASPLGMLSDEYLASAHALQHALLVLVVAPLLLAGLPTRLRPRLGSLRSPGAAAILAAAVLAVHLPPVLTAGLRSDAIHTLEHTAVFTAAWLAWATGAAPYLPLALAPTAAWLALSPAVLYPWYERAPRLWDLSPLADQHLAGWLLLAASLAAVAVVRLSRRRAALAVLLALVLLAAGCGRRTAQNTPGVRLALAVEPTPPAEGSARLTITATDARGRPVALREVEVRGDMNMPGMTPVVANAAEAAPGRYVVEGFRLTMAGEWILTVTGLMPDGRAFYHRLAPLEVVGR